MNETLLARNPDYTVKDFQNDCNTDNEETKKRIAKALERRFLQRYIEPGKCIMHKNGFNIMANCCLLIETLESFYRGWGSTPKGAEPFCKFFNRAPQFKDFTGNDMPTIFYKNIRCGILHQGETTSGWRIRRDLKQMLDIDKKIIDANYFRDNLEEAVKEYCKTLINLPMDAYEWTTLKKKMMHIIKNCQK